MNRTIIVFTCLLAGLLLGASDEKLPPNPSYQYDIARTHEIKPHRREIPFAGVRPGFNQLRLTLVVSPTGDVLDSDANGDPALLKIWPLLQGEVRQWKFIPFEQNGKAVTAEVEEYIDLVPPERLPKNHLPPPALRRDSKIAIGLERSGCFGSCPSYKVSVGIDGIVFEGGGYVVASGKHRSSVDADEVRKLAKRFIAADFYSMDASYTASVTDNPFYALSIAIDGHSKKVEDYVGSWEGMPGVITELEEEVDKVAGTERWIDGTGGLVGALQTERFNFKSHEAQVILKEAASRGLTETVRELLEAGVQLVPLPATKSKTKYEDAPFNSVGWLNAASRHPETLRILIDAGASNNDQSDKDLALIGVARSGNVESVRALVAFGANPNADLSKLTVTESSGGMTMQGQASGSLLIYAAESGNPEMIRDVLKYAPKLEMRDSKGRTAVFRCGRVSLSS